MGAMGPESGRALERERYPSTGEAREIAPGVAYLRTGIVNVFFVGEAGGAWTLVDAGMYGAAGLIRRAAAERFGEGARPAAIVLTHAHFDHRGALRELAEGWDVPVYAHPLELPYLTGRSSYPPPDPTVGGGAMAALSFAYPRGPVDLGARVRPLPADGSVPGMAGWRALHTPGHTPGHAAFFRDADRVLLAGDAFVTTRQESLSHVLAQTPEVNGPPSYFTQDWVAAEASVRALAALRPEVGATGHGVPLAGAPLREALERLARDFRARAVPARGRYVGSPAVADEQGTVSVPPAPAGARAALMLAGALVLGVAAGRALRR